MRAPDTNCPSSVGPHSESISIARGTTLPLGIERDSPLDQQMISLMPGSTLLLYTDGITDARDPQGVHFGLDRLQAAMDAGTGAPAQTLCDRLLRDVMRYQDVAPQHDDVTLVAVRRSHQTTR